MDNSHIYIREVITKIVDLYIVKFK
jgi:hypothetical protein